MSPHLDTRHGFDLSSEWIESANVLKASGWIGNQRGVRRSMARLLGCTAREVLATDTDAVNLAGVIGGFYSAVPPRRGVAVEWTSRETITAAAGEVLLSAGYDPMRFLAKIHPRFGEENLRFEDLEDFVVRYGHEYSTVVLGVGADVFEDLSDIGRIVAACHRMGASIGLDLTHAVGLAQLTLSEWNADFALWHNDRHLSSGAADEIGVYVNERHLEPGSVEDRWLHSSRPSWTQSGFRAHLAHLAGED